MGSDDPDIVGTLPNLYPFKVHSMMCTELAKLVDKIENIFREIEAARPRCSSGIQALCSLKNAIDRVNQYLQQCRESSKLYLAVTGDVILSRFQKSRSLLEQSLGQLQTMVPVILAAKITGIIDDLKRAKLVLDSSEEGAGKAIRELLQRGTFASDSVEYSELKSLQVAASTLQLTSPRAIVIEKRSIKKLLDKVSSNDPPKKKILNYFLLILKNYGNVIMAEHPETAKAQHERLFASMNSVELESCAGCGQNEAQTDTLSSPTPPEEFKCPISMRLMYDPVVIASGQTFERIWIQRWFDDGNDTCPKTKVKLAHCSLTPNTTIRDLISKWCEKYGITMVDPSLEAFRSFDISTTSIASLGSFVNNLQLPLDISNISLGSLDASYSSDSIHTMVADVSRLEDMKRASDSPRSKSSNMNETDRGFLSGLDELPWESKCKVVEDVKNHLQHEDQVCHSLSSKNFVDPLIKFMRESLDQNDVRAQSIGSQLLLLFATKTRREVSDLHEAVFSVLSSFLDSEVTHEVLAILEVLSGLPHYGPKFTVSGALGSILKIIDSQSKEFQEGAIKILSNLSSNDEICSQIVSLELIPKLVHFMNNDNLARYCIVALRNLCKNEEARVSIAESNGCIASIAKLLEGGNLEDQEHAVGILLSLCSQRVKYCKLVMAEGSNIIPSLFHISVNGNVEGKLCALELLRQLRDIDEHESCGSAVDAHQDAHEHEFFGSDLGARQEANGHESLGCDIDARQGDYHRSKEKKLFFKPSGFLKTMFSKRTSLASKKEVMTGNLYHVKT